MRKHLLLGLLLLAACSPGSATSEARANKAIDGVQSWRFPASTAHALKADLSQASDSATIKMFFDSTGKPYLQVVDGATAYQPHNDAHPCPPDC